jgi:hypothetical protein
MMALPSRGCACMWAAGMMEGLIGGAWGPKQATPNNIVYALVDSSEWIHGVELRLCMTPPKQPFQRWISFCSCSLIFPSRVSAKMKVLAPSKVGTDQGLRGPAHAATIPLLHVCDNK